MTDDRYVSDGKIQTESANAKYRRNILTENAEALGIKRPQGGEDRRNQSDDGPDGLLNYIKSLYEDNPCIYRGDGTTKTLYQIMSGIIQGCPLSGSVFVMVVDPLLRLLKKSLPDSTNRTFADDIATITQSLNDLITLKATFDLFKEVSGLDLKKKET